MAARSGRNWFVLFWWVWNSWAVKSLEAYPSSSSVTQPTHKSLSFRYSLDWPDGGQSSSLATSSNSEGSLNFVVAWDITTNEDGYYDDDDQQSDNNEQQSFSNEIEDDDYTSSTDYYYSESVDDSQWGGLSSTTLPEENEEYSTSPISSTSLFSNRQTIIDQATPSAYPSSSTIQSSSGLSQGTISSSTGEVTEDETFMEATTERSSTELETSKYYTELTSTEWVASDSISASELAFDDISSTTTDWDSLSSESSSTYLDYYDYSSSSSSPSSSPSSSLALTDNDEWETTEEDTTTYDTTSTDLMYTSSSSEPEIDMTEETEQATASSTMSVDTSTIEGATTTMESTTSEEEEEELTSTMEESSTMSELTSTSAKSELTSTIFEGMSSSKMSATPSSTENVEFSPSSNWGESTEDEEGLGLSTVSEEYTTLNEASDSEPSDSSTEYEDEISTLASSEISSTEKNGRQLSSSSSSFGSMLDDEGESEGESLGNLYLPGIPQKKVSGRMPLEVLVEEADMSLLGGAIRSNPKYELLKKVGMTIFAPVDSAFEGLPIDMKKLKSPSASLRDKGGLFSGRKSGSDANAEVEVEYGPKKRSLILDENITRRRILSSRMNRYGNKEPIDCSTQLSMEDPFYEECLYVQGSSEWQRSRSGPPLFEHPPYMNEDNNSPPQRNRMEDFEQLIMFHVVRRQIPPGMIESKKILSLRTEMKERMLEVRIDEIEPGVPVVFVNGDARVVEIISCKNGFIYKINKPLFPPWNIGYPSLIDAIRSNPRYSKLKFLLDQSRIFDKWALAGPITTLLIPDEAWRLDGLAVPSCFFKALARNENKQMLSKLLRWVTIPGIWTKEDIQRSEWLPNGIAPSLSVVNVRMLVHKNQEDFSKPSEIHTTTLIEGKEVTEWDIPLYNGYAHIISELPLRPDLDLRDILWDCLDSFCTECPIATKILLKYLDDGGLLPDIHNPRGYIVPPGVRPDWVCSDVDHWFPPGWDYHDWKKYLELAKSGSSKGAQNHAHAGWKKAAIRTAELLDKLDEAEVHLRKVWHIYGDPGSYVIGAAEDPNILIGWLKNRRSLEVKPRICEAKGPKKPGQILDRDIGENDLIMGDGFSPFNARTDYLNRLERERRRQFAMEDLRYVSQWVK